MSEEHVPHSQAIGNHAGTNVEVFTKRMNEVVKDGFTTLGLALGTKLGLFQTMSEIGRPATALEIAEASGCKERYIREWLYLMTSSEVVKMTSSSEAVSMTTSAEEHFYLPPDHQPGLGCGPVSAAHSKVCLSCPVRLLAANFTQLIEVFQKDGPPGIKAEDGDTFLENYENSDRKLDQVMESLLQSVPLLLNALEGGGEYFDIGGGEGHMALTFGRRFPGAQCHTCDIRASAINRGQERAQAQAVSNVTFHIVDINALPDEWSDRFSYATIIEVLHDLPFPVQSMKNIHRVMRPGAYLSVLDERFDSDPRISTKDSEATSAYGISLYHCLPLSLATPGSAAMGLVAGVQRLSSVLTQAGFTVERAPDIGTSYCHLVCQKPHTII